MDMAPDSARPHWPSGRVAWRQRQRGHRTRLDRTASAPARHPVVAPVRDWSGHQRAQRVGPVRVEELSQIPGAREALANYIGILQEWSLRADDGGAAP